MSIQAKFRCTSKTLKVGAEVEVRLDAATAGEANKSWSQYTPNGVISMTITNPGAHEQFVPGKEYFLTFRAAGEEAADGYSAHDLASAKAQGFRDGYASAQRGDAAPADNG